MRDWLAFAVPKQVPFLEFVNNNADFIRLRKTVFSDVMTAGNRFSVHERVADQIGRSTHIQYLEFGVFKGESILTWADTLNQNPDSRFVGFDTFTGLPEDWTKSTPKGTFDVDGQVPQTTDARVSFVPGLFQTTLEPFVEHRFVKDVPTVVHIDCDLYSATLFVLSSLHRVLPKGAYVIFDDFYSMNHEFRAFMDFARAFNCPWAPIASTTSCNVVAIRLD